MIGRIDTRPRNRKTLIPINPSNSIAQVEGSGTAENIDRNIVETGVPLSYAVQRPEMWMSKARFQKRSYCVHPFAGMLVWSKIATAPAQLHLVGRLLVAVQPKDYIVGVTGNRCQSLAQIRKIATAPKATSNLTE